MSTRDLERRVAALEKNFHRRYCTDQECKLPNTTVGKCKEARHG